MAWLGARPLWSGRCSFFGAACWSCLVGVLLLPRVVVCVLSPPNVFALFDWDILKYCPNRIGLNIVFIVPYVKCLSWFCPKCFGHTLRPRPKHPFLTSHPLPLGVRLAQYDRALCLRPANGVSRGCASTPAPFTKIVDTQAT
jgi:hypothetical protein